MRRALGDITPSCQNQHSRTIITTRGPSLAAAAAETEQKANREMFYKQLAVMVLFFLLLLLPNTNMEESTLWLVCARATARRHLWTQGAPSCEVCGVKSSSLSFPLEQKNPKGRRRRQEVAGKGSFRRVLFLLVLPQTTAVGKYKRLEK